MISTIQDLLKKVSGTSPPASLDHEQALQTATVALLMEVARADSGISDGERQAVERIIERYYSVSASEAREIADAAERHASDMTSLYPLTRLITGECSLEERVGLVRMLWEVAFSDGHADVHEEHLVRKVADLLYVPHNRFIQTRLQESGEE